MVFPVSVRANRTRYLSRTAEGMPRVVQLWTRCTPPTTGSPSNWATLEAPPSALMISWSGCFLLILGGITHHVE